MYEFNSRKEIKDFYDQNKENIHNWLKKEIEILLKMIEGVPENNIDVFDLRFNPIEDKTLNGWGFSAQNGWGGRVEKLNDEEIEFIGNKLGIKEIIIYNKELHYTDIYYFNQKGYDSFFGFELEEDLVIEKENCIFNN